MFAANQTMIAQSDSALKPQIRWQRKQRRSGRCSVCGRKAQKKRAGKFFSKCKKHRRLDREYHAARNRA